MFGKFKDFELNFRDGLNLILGPNESGKTTLYHFIKASLGSATADHLTKYKSWSGEEIDGFVSFQNGEVKSVRIDSTGVHEKLLEEDLIESLITMSDEEDIFDTVSVDQKIIARMKRKMQETRQAEEILKLLESIPNFEMMLIEKLQQLDLEIMELRKKVELFQKIRNEVLEQEVFKRKLEKKLQTVIEEKHRIAKKLEETEKEILAQVNTMKNDLIQKIDNLNLELRQLSMLPAISAEHFVKLSQAHQKIKGLEEKIRDLHGKLSVNRSRLEELSSKIDNLRKDLIIDELDKFKLKLKNLELSYKLVESKLDQLKAHENAYQANWRIFERRDFEVDTFLNQDTFLSIEKLKAQINEKMENLDRELLRKEKSKGRTLLLMVLCIFTGIASLVLGFTTAPFWHYISIGLGTVTGFLFFSYKKQEKGYDELSDEKIKAQIEIRNLERQMNQRRLPSGFEFPSYDELKRSYEQYRRWLKEDEEMKQLKSQVEEQAQQLLAELRIYGAKALSDIPSVLVWLNQKIFELEKAEYERLMIEKTIIQDSKNVEQLEMEVKELSKQFDSDLRDLGLQDVSELPEALKRNTRISELKNMIDSAKRLLESCENFELEKLARNNTKIMELLQEKSRLTSVMESLKKQVDELSEQLEGQKKLTESIEIPKITEYLRELSLKDLQKKVYERLRERIPTVRKILADELEKLTGSYIDKFGSMLKDLFTSFSNLASSMTVDKDLSVKFFVANKEQNLDVVLSKGTLDQLALCYKIALYYVLNPSDPLPLILDNFLIRFDEERLSKAAKLLTEVAKERQVIVLTSDTRLKDLLEVEPLITLRKS